MSIQIVGLGIAGAIGNTLESLHELTSNGNLLPNGKLEFRYDCDDIFFPYYETDTAALKEFLASAKLRRVNKFSRMAALAAGRALQNASLAIPVSNDRVGLVVASGYGASTSTFDFLADIITDGDVLASPTKFSNSLHSVAASNLSILFDMKGPIVTVTQFEMSAIAALLSAQHMLEFDDVDYVLVGGVDECNDVLGYCYKSYWPGSDKCETIKPFQFDYQSAIPGEGAAFLVLAKQKDNGSNYGRITEVAWLNIDYEINFADQPVILNMDGHISSARQYSKVISHISAENRKVYSPFTGSMPVGQFFDLVLGIASQKAGQVDDLVSLKINSKGDMGVIKYSV